MTHKLLLDENISPRMAETLCREDRVLVTCNIEDFAAGAIQLAPTLLAPHTTHPK